MATCRYLLTYAYGGPTCPTMTVRPASLLLLWALMWLSVMHSAVHSPGSRSQWWLTYYRWWLLYEAFSLDPSGDVCFLPLRTGGTVCATPVDPWLVIPGFREGCCRLEGPFSCSLYTSSFVLHKFLCPWRVPRTTVAWAVCRRSS